MTISYLPKKDEWDALLAKVNAISNVSADTDIQVVDMVKALQEKVKDLEEEQTAARVINGEVYNKVNQRLSNLEEL